MLSRRTALGATFAALLSLSALPSCKCSKDPPRDPATSMVIIYGADWCGPCHDAEAFLKERGVPFVSKNVETDRSAARELMEKLEQNGKMGGSIPVLDVNGKILIGFNPTAVERALR